MTRINAGIPVESLSSKHLIAEHREIKRICSRLKKRIQKNKFDDIPAPFHTYNDNGDVVLKELFWLDKGKFTLTRYLQIYEECKKRGFNMTNFSNSWEIYKEKPEFFNDHIPTPYQIQIIKDRIELKNRISIERKRLKNLDI